MKINLRMHSLIPVTLLFIFCISGCLAYRKEVSDEDNMMKKNDHTTVSVVRELPKKGKISLQAYTVSKTEEKDKGNNWAPLRIVTSTLDLKYRKRYCDYQWVNRSKFDGTYGQCTAIGHILDEKKKFSIKNVILPEAIKLHTERLLVQPLSEPLKVPEFIKRNTTCQFFTVPEEHFTTGIKNTDMVIYVASGPLDWFGTGAICAKGKDNRPIVGSLALRADFHQGKVYWTRFVAHEIAHVLGFDYNLMKELNMISNITTNIRGKPYAIVVNSTKTKEKAQEHYNCKNIEGMELQGEELEERSHWNRRNAKDELMSAEVGIGFYTSLTMAAFEDMKFYKVNWGMEEPMKWGNNSGCELLEQKCMENGKSKYPEMFCEENKVYYHCTSDRLYIGYCNIKKQVSDIPKYFQYFTDPKYGGSSSEATEYCPIITSKDQIPCRKREKEEWGNRFGHSSWCLNGDSLTVESSNGQTVNVGGVCVKVLCTDGIVKVRYSGIDFFVNCPEGKSITAKSDFVRGKIKCPKYNEVCTIAFNGSSLIIPPLLPTPTPSLPEIDRSNTESVNENVNNLPNSATTAAGNSNSQNGNKQGTKSINSEFNTGDGNNKSPGSLNSSAHKVPVNSNSFHQLPSSMAENDVSVNTFIFLSLALIIIVIAGLQVLPL